MGERTHPNNLIWVACCCGCLPILGLIKGILVVGPNLLISLIGFTGISIILLPHDIFLTYKAACKTSIIGINLKIMTMLLLPIALFSWPIFVVFASSLYGIFYGLFGPVFYTFNPDYNIIYGGIIDVIKDTFKFIKEFWRYNYNSYFIYLREIEEKKVDKPFDINIIQLIIGLILAIYGSAVGSTIFILMWIIKLIPSIYRMYYFAFKTYCELSCLEMFMYLIFYVIGFCLIPAVGVLAILAYIGYGLYGGIFCAYEGYKYNICRGLISIWNTIRECDELTNELIFGNRFSCFPDCSKYYLKEKETNPSLESKESDEAKSNLVEGNEEGSNLKEEKDS